MTVNSKLDNRIDLRVNDETYARLQYVSDQKTIAHTTYARLLLVDLLGKRTEHMVWDEQTKQLVPRSVATPASVPQQAPVKHTPTTPTSVQAQQPTPKLRKCEFCTDCVIPGKPYCGDPHCADNFQDKQRAMARQNQDL